MALQLTKTFETGVSGNYWRIIRVNVDVLARRAEFTLGLFIDAAAFADAKKPLFLDVTSLTGDDYPFSPSNSLSEVLAVGYGLFLAHPEYTSATVVP